MAGEQQALDLGNLTLATFNLKLELIFALHRFLQKFGHRLPVEPACRYIPATAGRSRPRTWDQFQLGANSDFGAHRRSAWNRIRRTGPQLHRLSCCCSARRARSTRLALSWDVAGSLRAYSPPKPYSAIYLRTTRRSDLLRGNRKLVHAGIYSGRTPTRM